MYALYCIILYCVIILYKKCIIILCYIVLRTVHCSVQDTKQSPSIALIIITAARSRPHVTNATLLVAWRLNGKRNIVIVTSSLRCSSSLSSPTTPSIHTYLLTYSHTYTYIHTYLHAYLHTYLLTYLPTYYYCVSVIYVQSNPASYKSRSYFKLRQCKRCVSWRMTSRDIGQPLGPRLEFHYIHSMEHTVTVPALPVLPCR